MAGPASNPENYLGNKQLRAEHPPTRSPRNLIHPQMGRISAGPQANPKLPAKTNRSGWISRPRHANPAERGGGGEGEFEVPRCGGRRTVW